MRTHALTRAHTRTCAATRMREAKCAILQAKAISIDVRPIGAGRCPNALEADSGPLKAHCQHADNRCVRRGEGPPSRRMHMRVSLARWLFVRASGVESLSYGYVRASVTYGKLKMRVQGVDNGDA